jgi:hypothetical protein
MMTAATPHRAGRPGWCPGLWQRLVVLPGLLTLDVAAGRGLHPVKGSGPG